MKFTDEEGKVWEWRGETRKPKEGEFYMGGPGRIYKVTWDDTSGRESWLGIRTILHPVPTIHEFGGVRFEETGEIRRAKQGEWFLATGYPHPVFHYGIDAYYEEHPILRPLQGE